MLNFTWSRPEHLEACTSQSFRWPPKAVDTAYLPLILLFYLWFLYIGNTIKEIQPPAPSIVWINIRASDFKGQKKAIVPSALVLCPARHRLTASGSQHEVFFRSKFSCTIQQQAAVLSKHIIATEEMQQFFSHLYCLHKYHNLTPFFPWLMHGIG